MAIEAEQREYAPKSKKPSEEEEKRRKKVATGSLMKAIVRPGGGDEKPVDKDQVIYHCIIRTLDGVIVHSTKSEHGESNFMSRTARRALSLSSLWATPAGLLFLDLVTTVAEEQQNRRDWRSEMAFRDADLESRPWDS